MWKEEIIEAITRAKQQTKETRKIGSNDGRGLYKAERRLAVCLPIILYAAWSATV